MTAVGFSFFYQAHTEGEAAEEKKKMAARARRFGLDKKPESAEVGKCL